MKPAIFAAVAASFSLARASPLTRHVRHERREVEAAASQWVKRDVVDPSFSLPMRIALTQSNLHRGYDLLMEVSDPTSSKYGQHYTAEEVHDIFAPSIESVDAVRAWLAEAGIALDRTSQSHNRQFIQFDADTAEVEELLKTKFHVYEHQASGKTSVGCDEYHVKEDIQHHIDYITPGVRTLGIHLPGNRKRQANLHKNKPIKTPAPPHLVLSANSVDYCDDYISPACIMAMYNISAGTTAQAGNELGIFEETAQYLDQEDLNVFFTNLYPTIPNGTFPILQEIDGAKNINDPSKAGTECLLDFQISYPILFPQNSKLFLTDSVYEASHFGGGLFNTFLDAIDGSYCTYSAYGETGNNNTVDPHYPSKGYRHKLQCGVYEPTNVISASYELAELGIVPTAAYEKRQCNEYMKLGLQGVSVVFSSGDSGVSGYVGCQGTKKQPLFNPDFPSDCPYVTSVGATTLTGAAKKDVERAVTQFPSGGGFSNYHARPSYQNAAVEAYFKTDRAPNYPYYTGPEIGDGLYNRSGRAAPDVAAIGQAVVNIGGKAPYLVGGTSASAPVFAAILTRINEERLKAGKSTVGFVNPTLYQNPQAFHDITVGNNIFTKEDGANQFDFNCVGYGFNTAVGWDPVTGLGTPNYPVLLDVFMKAS